MNENQKKIILVIVSILILLLVVLSVMKKVNDVESDLTEEQTLELQAQVLEQKKIDKITTMTERERIEYYFSEFIKAVDNGKYSDAYDMLNNDFKENYFKTVEEFESYAKSYFPKEIAIEYNNIERNGSIYILWVTMVNPIAVDKSNAKDFNVIIQENEVGNFEMSFSVEL